MRAAEWLIRFSSLRTLQYSSQSQHPPVFVGLTSDPAAEASKVLASPIALAVRTRQWLRTIEL